MGFVSFLSAGSNQNKWIGVRLRIRSGSEKGFRSERNGREGVQDQIRVGIRVWLWIGKGKGTRIGTEEGIRIGVSCCQPSAKVSKLVFCATPN